MKRFVGFLIASLLFAIPATAQTANIDLASTAQPSSRVDMQLGATYTHPLTSSVGIGTSALYGSRRQSAHLGSNIVLRDGSTTVDLLLGIGANRVEPSTSPFNDRSTSYNPSGLVALRYYHGALLSFGVQYVTKYDMADSFNTKGWPSGLRLQIGFGGAW